MNKKTPSKAERQAEFARAVLLILEHSEEWNADTLDEIADRAVNLGLAKENGRGMFKVAP